MSEKPEREAGVIKFLFARNWLTIFGASLTTASAFLIIGMVMVALFGWADNPYLGIIAFLILPGVFVFGLLLIPLGALLDRRRMAREQGPEAAASLTIDLRNRRIRRALGLIAFLTVVNLFVISSVTYRGVHFMESEEFCGTVCHTVMEPEYTAYLNSPHARVSCVDCHIGPGAPWFVRSKLDGVRQVFAVMFDTYQRPIPTPVEHLRPSAETCETCHWPEQFTGDRMRVITQFSEDEENTPLTTALLLHIGGGEFSTGGIHSWHIDPYRETRYLPATPDRQEISLVRVREADGTIRNFARPDFEGDPAAVPDTAMRVMDCIDCHNRPTHVFKLPNEAVDEAMARGRIDNTLPYIKRMAVEVLNAAAEAPTAEEARMKIAQRLHAYYRENYDALMTTRRETIEAAIREVQTIYSQNVFPEMDVTWGTYPNNISHVNFPGCFRCHDDSFRTHDGFTIRQDCTMCHAVLAWQEFEPEILRTLGIQ